MVKQEQKYHKKLIKKEQDIIKWEEVRRIYPNKFVKVQILKYHLEGNNKVVDDMAVIRVIDNNKEATNELMNCKDDTIVYHTANEKISIEIKILGAYRGIIYGYVYLDLNRNLLYNESFKLVWDCRIKNFITIYIVICT